MKRIICILTVFLLLLSLAACKKGPKEEQSASSDALVTEPEVKPEQQPEQKPETEPEKELETEPETEVEPEKEPEINPEPETEAETEQTETPKDETQQEEPETEPETEPELTPDQNELEKQKKLEIVKKLNEQTEKELKDYYGEDYVIVEEEKYLPKIDENFSSELIIVVLTKDYSAIKRKYTKEDFPYLDLEKTRILFENSRVDNNAIMLDLYLKNSSKQKIIDAVELLNQDKRIEFSTPDYIGPIT